MIIPISNGPSLHPSSRQHSEQIKTLYKLPLAVSVVPEGLYAVFGPYIFLCTYIYLFKYRYELWQSRYGVFRRLVGDACKKVLTFSPNTKRGPIDEVGVFTKSSSSSGIAGAGLQSAAKFTTSGSGTRDEFEEPRGYTLSPRGADVRAAGRV